MIDALEKLRILFRPKTNRAGVCVDCLSNRTRVSSSPRGGPLYCRCDGCGHTWKQPKYEVSTMAKSVPIQEKQPGYLYFIGAREGGLVKIGITFEAPETRLRNLQTGSPILLSIVAWVYVLDPRSAELGAHQHFEVCRVRGEWFQIAEQDAVGYARTIGAERSYFSVV